MAKSPIKAFRWIDKKFNENPLTKNNKFSAYVRYIKFNLGQTLLQKEVVYPFLKHTKFYAKKGLSGIVPNIYFGLHEIEEMSFLLHYLIPSDIFLDIGANVGAYSLLASGEKKCKSISIEPIPKTFEYLKKNIELNKLEKIVTLYNYGISDKNGSLYFSNNKDSMNHVVDKKYTNSVKVDVYSLDNLIQETINYIKIDVEGFEKFVLDGAENILKNEDLNVLQIELNTFGEKFNTSDEDINDLILSYGFKPCKYHPFKRHIELLEHYRKDQYNTIYIKDIDKAQNRINTAKVIKVRNFSF